MSRQSDTVLPMMRNSRRVDIEARYLTFILHPEEVELLRHVYQDAFILIGVVSDGREAYPKNYK